MKQITLYIGSPNDTHVIDEAYLSKVTVWADKHLAGYTLLRGRAFWQGNSEECSVLIAITDTPLDILSIQELRMTLYQDSILVTEHDVDCTLITGKQVKEERKLKKSRAEIEALAYTKLSEHRARACMPNCPWCQEEHTKRQGIVDNYLRRTLHYR